MEFPQRIETAARKENIPPALSRHMPPRDQRTIQKNVNVNLFLASGNRLRALWPQTSSNLHGSNSPGGRRGTCGLFQTNLLCPSRSSWAVAKDALPQQQSNLGASLQRRRWGSGTLQVGLKGSPLSGSLDRCRDVPRMERRDQDLLTCQHGFFPGSKASYGGLTASRESSSPTQFSVAPSLDSPPNSCPLPMTFNGIHESSPPGPALALDNPISSLVDGHPPPAGLQALVRSSHSSADLHWSLQRVKKKPFLVEANVSFPRESQSSPQVPWPPCKPQLLTSIVQEVPEASVEGSSYAQMSNKQRTTLSPTLSACQGGYSSSPICRSRSGRQPASDSKATWGRLKTQGYPRTLGTQEIPSGSFCGSGLYLKDLPLDVFSLKALESSLETGAESSLSKGLSMDDPPEEEPPSVHLSGDLDVPVSHPFGKGMGDLTVHGEAGGSPIITYSVDGVSLLTAPQEVNPFREAIWKPPRKTDKPDTNPTRGENMSSAGQRSQSHVPPAGKAREGAEPPSWREREDGRPLPKKEEEEGEEVVERRGGSPPLLATCFMAWHGHVFGNRDAALALHRRHLLHKGVGALWWAVQLGGLRREAARRHHTLAVLAGSFRKWQGAAVKRPGVEEPGAPAWGKDAIPGRMGEAGRPPEGLQVCRAECFLWMQLRDGGEGRLLSKEGEDVRDLRLPAAAHRLRHLREETLEQDGGPLREARALLEEEEPGEAFGSRRARCRERQRVLLLTSRIQSGLVGRCLKAWKRLAQRQRQSEVGLQRLRAKSLRACFRQWSLMVRAREKAKRAVTGLLAVQWQSSCGAPGAQRGPGGARWPQKDGEDSLDYLFRLRALQGAFQTWKARCWQAQQAGAFCQGLALRQLRGALEWWRRRTPALTPLGLTEGSLLASLDPQGSSFSSGLPSTSSSGEKEIQPGQPSPISRPSLVTAEDPHLVPPPGSCCPRCNPDRENATHVASRFPVQDSPLRLNGQAASECGRVWRPEVRLRQFKGAQDAWRLAKAWLRWKDARRAQLAVRALRWRRWAQWGWGTWRRRWLQLQVARRFQGAEEEQLLRTALGRWRHRLVPASRAQAE